MWRCFGRKQLEMKKTSARQSEIEDTIEERALNCLYALRAYVEKREKKKCHPLTNRERYRNRHQVTGH